MAPEPWGDILMKFRLDSLLKLRTNQERLEQLGLAKIQAHLIKQQQELDVIDSGKRRSQASLKQKWSRPIQSDTLILYHNFERGLQANQEKQEKVVAATEEQAVAQRAELTEAMRKRRMLQILKEKEYLRRKKQEQKTETAFLDEIASNQWLMRSR